MLIILYFYLSFPDCYAAKFSPLQLGNETLEGSVPLEHLITCVPSITVVTAQNGFKVIKWIHNKPPTPNSGRNTRVIHLLMCCRKSSSLGGKNRLYYQIIISLYFIDSFCEEKYSFSKQNHGFNVAKVQWATLS